MGQLNELQIKAAQPRDKEYMLSEEGLYLRVRPNGKVWIYRYKQAGKQAKLSFGSYPTVSLAVARRKTRDEAEKRAGGVDPRDARREQVERDRVARLNTFELMARAWHAQAQKDRQWSAGYAEKVMRHLELHIFPWIGSLTMEAIKPTELVRCLHRIKERGNLETAQRVREAVQHVFQYAVDVGALEPAKNFVNSRTGGLPAPRARHCAAITDPQKLGQLLCDIRAYNGNVITRAALQLSPLLFQRPGQLRLAHWEDIDFEPTLWRCPPEKMKLREWKKHDVRTPAHLVPLPTQAVDILRDIFPLTGPIGPIFRSMAKRSEATRYMRQHGQQRVAHARLRHKGADHRARFPSHRADTDSRTVGLGPRGDRTSFGSRVRRGAGQQL